jgi:ubiquitin
LRLSARHLGRGATVRIRQSCSRPAEQGCCWTFDRHSVSER